MIHFTSDTHFGHGNVIRYCNRPVLRPDDLNEQGYWKSDDIRIARTKEMDDIIIDNWNSAVKPKDKVYHLGDFAWCNHQHYSSRLNGDITLILGNHDKKPKFYEDTCEFIVKTGYHDIKISDFDDPLYITLCHFSMRTWEKAHYGAWHFYGHTHGDTLPVYGKSLNVSVDGNNFRTWSLDDVIEKMKTLPHNPGFISKSERIY